jgi:predicted nucleic acid-binding protein
VILYLDASALVKRYIREPGTPEVAEALAGADVVGTSVISRVETAAALAKAIRVGTLTRQTAASALQVFRSEWPALVRVRATEVLVVRADELAWQLGLRGYGALHLASALTWQEGMGEEVTVATFDRQLWKAAGQRGLPAFPRDLPTMLAAWQKETPSPTFLEAQRKPLRCVEALCGQASNSAGVSQSFQEGLLPTAPQ